MKERKTIPNAQFFATVEELLAQGKSVDITVKGFSMRPFLRNGKSVVTLSPVGENEVLRRGMVVLFRHNSAHVLHRFRGVMTDGMLRMVGDGNYRLEEVVRREAVVARVSAVKSRHCEFRYGSLCWCVSSAWSLMIKSLRTAAITVKRTIIR